MDKVKGFARRVANCIEKGVGTDRLLLQLVDDGIRFQYLMEHCLTKEGDIIQYAPNLRKVIDEELRRKALIDLSKFAGETLS